MRKVLITGGNRGLGFKLAEVLSPKHHILLTARNLSSLNEAKRKITAIVPNASITTQELDVSRFDSVKAFHKWMLSTNTTVDVIVNNAGVNDENQLENKAFDIMNTNLFGIINLTETILPQLTQDGKIILISSMLGKLKLQPPSTQKLLQEKLTKQQILQFARDLIHNYKEGNYGIWSSHIQPLYKVSKVLTNAYARHVLADLVQPNQSIFCVHPGWVKTDMGGPKAPGEVKDGIFTSRYLIEELPYGRNPQYHAKYFNDKAQIEDY
ncbi:unnamed protein product (macronuclear) [Paramecium tetraurelia]|uniref:Short chain dehydrogenase n=1 Tax=Paramecium tetraurelia TaxID=5888 RepID=A0D5I7_PARTE|nr:uncharacterized protein GSPATT00013734001 [Paramecium tetraurelia]CAK78304.1 unnamed protein product [Paramecium tetraurelia]|eukprot:XP_001445701.1 hypothetical protein (macronuclear) [Paramecium tetraurelia strain d4-2]